MAPCLSAVEIRKRFGGITAVDGVSLSVGEGERLGIIGPNGSGKTTLLSTLVGLVRPDSGRVTFDGHDVTRAPPFSRARRSLSLTFQTPRVFPSLTVAENMEVGRYAKRVPLDSRSDRDLLEQLQLARMRSALAASLSGGQKKLLEFARALAARPRLVVADEPTAGVSAAAQRAMTAAIEEASARGIAFLIVSHDLPWMFGICREIKFLAGGCVVVEGDPEVVRSDPRVVEAYLR